MITSFTSSPSIVAVGMKDGTAMNLHYITDLMDKYESYDGPKNAQAAIQKTASLPGSPLSNIGRDTLPGWTGEVPHTVTYLLHTDSMKRSMLAHCGKLLGYASWAEDDFDPTHELPDLSKFVQLMSAVKAHASLSFMAMEPVVVAEYTEYLPGQTYSDMVNGSLTMLMKDKSRINDLGDALAKVGNLYRYSYENLETVGTLQDLATNLWTYDSSGITRKALTDAGIVFKGPLEGDQKLISDATDDEIAAVLKKIISPDLETVMEAMGATMNESILNLYHVYSVYRMLVEINGYITFKSFNDLGVKLKSWAIAEKIKSTEWLVKYLRSVKYQEYDLLNALPTPMDPDAKATMIALYGEGTGDYDSVALHDMIGTLYGVWIGDSVAKLEELLKPLFESANGQELDKYFKMAADVMDGVYDHDIANYPDPPAPPGPVNPPVPEDWIIRIPGFGDFDDQEEAIDAIKDKIEYYLDSLYTGMSTEATALNKEYLILSDRIKTEDELLALAGIDFTEFEANQYNEAVQFGMSIKIGIKSDEITDLELLYTALAAPDQLAGQAILASIDEQKLLSVKL